jgi:hypothetical protein
MGILESPCLLGGPCMWSPGLGPSGVGVGCYSWCDSCVPALSPKLRLWGRVWTSVYTQYVLIKPWSVNGVGEEAAQECHTCDISKQPVSEPDQPLALFSN